MRFETFVVVNVGALLLIAFAIHASWKKRKKARRDKKADREMAEFRAELALAVAPRHAQSPRSAVNEVPRAADVVVVEPDQRDWDRLVAEFGVRKIRDAEVLGRVNWHLPAALLGIPLDDSHLGLPLSVWWPYGRREFVLVTELAPSGITEMTVHRVELGWLVIVLHPDDMKRVLCGELEAPDSFGNQWQKIA